MEIVGRELHVWVVGSHVGILQEILHSNLPPTYRFTYDANVSKNQYVSLTMPIKKGRFDLYRFFPVFESNLPEGVRLSALLNAGKLTRVDDAFGLACVVGEHMPGSIQLTVKNHPPSELPEMEMDLSAGERNWFDRIMRESGLRHGISGIMEKMFSEDVDAKIIVNTATHIVKAFDGKKYPHLNCNEWLCLNAARAAGLEVPDAKLSPDFQLLFIQRFDLLNGRPIYFEEFASLCGRLAREKYMGSFEEIADVIDSYVPVKNGMQTIAKRALFKNIALSVAIGNGDLHLKNLGLLDHPPRLSPTYDVVTTRAYLSNNEEEGAALALSWGNYSKRWWSRAELTEFSLSVLFMDHRDAENALQEVIDGILATIPKIDEMILRNPDFVDVGNKMKSIWLDGIQLISANKNDDPVSRCSRHKLKS